MATYFKFKTIVINVKYFKKFDLSKFILKLMGFIMKKTQVVVLRVRKPKNIKFSKCVFLSIQTVSINHISVQALLTEIFSGFSLR